VVGTARSREEVDPALLQPGRLELVLEVGPPTAEDCRELLLGLDRELDLQLTPEALDRAAELALRGDSPTNPADRLQALCRALARQRLREGCQGPTLASDFERAFELL
jgi:cell division protease FtsH